MYGIDQPTYQSSMKESMVPHSLKGQGEVRQQIKEQVQSLRKHNYILGFDDVRDAQGGLTPDKLKTEAYRDAARGKSIS